jgi:hypothetical protein
MNNMCRLVSLAYFANAGSSYKNQCCKHRCNSRLKVLIQAKNSYVLSRKCRRADISEPETWHFTVGRNLLKNVTDGADLTALLYGTKYYVQASRFEVNKYLL